MTIPACKGSPDPEVFYEPPRWADAAKICAGCPLLMECRQAFAFDEHAFAGGMDPQRRARWARKRAEAKAPGPRANNGYTAITDEVREAIRGKFDEGKGIKIIAREVGLARSTVQRFLLREGLTRTAEERRELMIRNSAAAGRSDGAYTEASVLKLLAEEYTPAEVANLLGITVGHVYVVRRRSKERGPE